MNLSFTELVIISCRTAALKISGITLTNIDIKDVKKVVETVKK